MVSFLQRLALAIVAQDRPILPRLRLSGSHYGTSKRTVAQDRRRAAKARARRRAQRLGQA